MIVERAGRSLRIQSGPGRAFGPTVRGQSRGFITSAQRLQTAQRMESEMRFDSNPPSAARQRLEAREANLAASARAFRKARGIPEPCPDIGYRRRLAVIGHPPPWSEAELRAAEIAFRRAKREHETGLKAAMLSRARQLLDFEAGGSPVPASPNGSAPLPLSPRGQVLAAWDNRPEAALSRYEIRTASGLSKSAVQRAVAYLTRAGILSTNGNPKLLRLDHPPE